MERKHLFTAFVLAGMIGSGALAAAPATSPVATAESKINDALKAVETLQTQAQANNAADQSNDVRQTKSYFERVKSAVAKKDWSAARTAALNASHMVQSPEFQVVWSELLVELNKQQETLQASFPDAVKAELDKARSTCLAAKSEDELDGLEEELQGMANQANRMPRSDGGVRVGRDTDYTRLQNAAQAVRYWRDMLAAKSSGNMSSALMHLSNIQNISQYRLFTPTILEKYRRDMIDAVSAQRDQRLAAFAAAIAKASNLDECQKLVDSFDKEVRLNSGRNVFDGGMDDGGRLSRAGQTAQVWIDVNRTKEGGKPHHALALLDQDWHLSMRPGMVNFSAGMSLDYGVIPEKKWTDLKTELQGMVADEGKVIREPALKQEVEALDKADTLEDFLAAVAENPVDANRIPGEYSQTAPFDNQTVVAELTALAPDVARLSAMREDLANSRFRNIIASWSNAAASPAGERVDATSYRVPVFSAVVGNYRWKHRVDGFKRQMLVEAIKGFSQISELKLEGEESPDQMLLRIADAAFKAQDYHKTLLALDAYRETFYGANNPPEWLASDIRGCSEYLAGMNYQSAEVPLDAAKSFLAVLGETGPLAPTKQAGQQIKTLREKFPEIVSSAAAQVSPGSAALVPAAAPAASLPPVVPPARAAAPLPGDAAEKNPAATRP